jgi:hypothetical protein
MTQDGRWVYARDLQVDDVVRSHSFGTQKISALEISLTQTMVYNFLTDDLHNYTVGENGILVHNVNTPPKIEKIKRGKGEWDEGEYDTPIKNGDYLDALQEVKREFLRNDVFRRWFDGYKKKIKASDGKYRNPDMSWDSILEAYKEWLTRGKPDKN